MKGPFVVHPKLNMIGVSVGEVDLHNHYFYRVMDADGMFICEVFMASVEPNHKEEFEEAKQSAFARAEEIVEALNFHHESVEEANRDADTNGTS